MHTHITWTNQYFADYLYLLTLCLFMVFRYFDDLILYQFRFILSLIDDVFLKVTKNAFIFITLLELH